VIDWVVILTPLLVLGVLMVLGYAGCRFDPSGGAARPPRFDIVLRAPATAGTVTEITYGCTPPGGAESRVTETNPEPDFIDNPETSEPTNGYRHTCFLGPDAPPAGTWGVRCRVTMSTDVSGADTAEAFAEVDASDFPDANFQATGSPATADFDVVFVGTT
jgi:hypothetical protein